MCTASAAARCTARVARRYQLGSQTRQIWPTMVESLDGGSSEWGHMHKCTRAHECALASALRVHSCMCMQLHLHECMNAGTGVLCTCVLVLACLCVCMCACVCACVHACVCVCACACACAPACGRAHAHVRCVCMHVCTCLGSHGVLALGVTRPYMSNACGNSMGAAT